MNATHDTTLCIHLCNGLLRGEISAIETYTQAIENFRLKDQPEASDLEALRRNHVTSANQLREVVRELGGVPSNDSGPWGSFAMTVEGVAQFLGPAAALKALLKGEQHGEEEYTDAIQTGDATPEVVEMIRTDLLPRQRTHVRALQDLIRDVA